MNSQRMDLIILEILVAKDITSAASESKNCKK